MDIYLSVLKKYVVFEGRAGLKEFWMFTLFNFIISFVLSGIDMTIGTFGALSFLYSVAVFLPSLAVTVRRLHDTDRSGWWVLVSFIPIVGVIILLILWALEGTEGPNQYGMPQDI
jgi:uncharacterized membrane protein YhaH (DUF805 family)